MSEDEPSGAVMTDVFGKIAGLEDKALLDKWNALMDAPTEYAAEQASVDFVTQLMASMVSLME